MNNQHKFVAKVGVGAAIVAAVLLFCWGVDLVTFAVLITYAMLITALVWVLFGADSMGSDPDRVGEVFRHRLSAATGILIMATILAIASLAFYKNCTTADIKVKTDAVTSCVDKKLEQPGQQVKEAGIGESPKGK